MKKTKHQDRPLTREEMDLWKRYTSSPPRFIFGSLMHLPSRQDRRSSSIDLHGMTLNQAHRAVMDFLEHHACVGSRSVLIITGKRGRISRELPHWCVQVSAVSSCRPVMDSMGEHGSYRVTFRRKNQSAA